MNFEVLIFGKGGHASVIVDALDSGTNYHQVDSGDDISSYLTQVRKHIFIIGIGDNYIRESIFNQFVSAGNAPLTVIHPTAFVSKNATIGLGTYIGPNVSICSGAKVGMGCIINTNSSVDHDCKIGDFSHIAPGSHLCGKVKIGDRTLIGVGTHVIPNINIGNDSIVGAGSLVLEDVSDNTEVFGSPAKFYKILDTIDNLN